MQEEYGRLISKAGNSYYRYDFNGGSISKSDDVVTLSNNMEVAAMFEFDNLLTRDAVSDPNKLKLELRKWEDENEKILTKELVQRAGYNYVRQEDYLTSKYLYVINWAEESKMDP